jgi:TolA-binding protein
VAAVPARSAESPEEQLATAALLHQQKDYNGAAAKLEAFLARNAAHPKAGPAQLLLGQCRLLTGQFAKAAVAFQKALALSKDPRLVAPARLGAGEALVKSDRLEEAQAALKAALGMKLESDQQAAAEYWMGESLFRQKRFQEARASYTRSVKAAPQGDLSVYAAYSAALCAAEAGDPKTSIEELRHLLQVAPRSDVAPEARLRLADALVASNQTAEAAKEYEKALGLPGELGVQAEQGLVRALLRLKRYDAALPRLKALLPKQQAGSTEYYQTALSLGLCYFQAKQFGEAGEAYDVAAKSSEPEVAAAALYGKARSLESLGRQEQAVSAYEAVAARFPESAQGKEAKSYAVQLQAAGPLPKDEAGLLKRLQSAPSEEAACRVRYALAALYRDQGQSAKAAQQAAALGANPAATPEQKLAAGALEMEARLATGETARAEELAKGLDRDGVEPDLRGPAVYVQAWALEKAGKSAEAAPLWERLAAEFPSSPYLREALFRLAELKFDKEDYEGAEAGYRKVLEMPADPKDAALLRLARFKRASALYNLKQYAPSLVAYRDFGTRYPKDPLSQDALFWTALSLGKLDRRAEERQALERFVKTCPKHAMVPQAKARLAALKGPKPKPA